MTNPRLAAVLSAAPGFIFFGLLLVLAFVRGAVWERNRIADERAADDDHITAAPTPASTESIPLLGEEWKRSLTMVPFCYSPDPAFCEHPLRWSDFHRPARVSISFSSEPSDDLMLMFGKKNGCPSGMHYLPPWATVCISDKHTLEDVQIEAAKQAVGNACRDRLIDCEGI